MIARQIGDRASGTGPRSQAHRRKAAAEVAVGHGVRAILNFAPVLLKVPVGVVVRNVSFLQELAVLSYQLTANDKRDLG